MYLKKELQNFDVIHLNGYRSFFIAQIARAAQRVGIPYVVQPRGTLPVIMNNYSLKKIYDIVFGSLELEGLSGLIALQEEERQQALARRVPDSRIYIIPNGLDLEEQTQSSIMGGFRERYNIPADKKLILFVGRINKEGC